MRNGFGLKVLHKFFNLPFLQLQKESLLTQLQKNEIETRNTIKELDKYSESDEANYTKFMEKLSKKRRDIADLNTNMPPTANIVINTNPLPQMANPIVKPITPEATISIVPTPIIINNPMTKIQGVKQNLSLPINTVENQGSIKSVANTNLVKNSNIVPQEKVPDVRKIQLNTISVEEFCPDGGQIDKHFLEDDQVVSSKNSPTEIEETER